jgi:hypothetical protein
MLHVRGSLGSITLALLQQWDSILSRFLSYATLAPLADNNVNKQNCYARNKRHRDVTMVFELRRIEQSVLESTRGKSGVKIVRVQTCLCVGLWTPFGWKIKFVTGKCERRTRVYTVDGEDIRSSGMVNSRLMMDYTPRCCCGVQVDRCPDDGLSRRVFGDFLTARMGMSVGRLPQEVLLEEFYRSECSRDRAGRTCTCVRRVAGCV